MQEVLSTFINEAKKIGGFIAVSVTEVESGVSYESFTANPDFDPELASAYNLEVVRAKLKAIEALGLVEAIEDITITLTDQVHILNVSPNGSYFIYLAVDSEKSNLGITKALLNKHKKALFAAI